MNMPEASNSPRLLGRSTLPPLCAESPVDSGFPGFLGLLGFKALRPLGGFKPLTSQILNPKRAGVPKQGEDGGVALTARPSNPDCFCNAGSRCRQGARSRASRALGLWGLRA